jgi:type I restriction enzyme S subunit
MYGGLTGKSGDDFRKDEDDPTNKPFIPFTNICNNTYIKRDDLKLVSINEGDNQNRVEKDDLFFMMTSETQGDVGKTSVLKDDLGEVYLNTFCKGFRITDRSVNPYFLNYLLNGKPYRELLSVEGNGFTRINLRQDRVNDFILFSPPLSEQEQIVKYLDEKTNQIDQLISITEKKIVGLKEKRTSLINHVVSNGLDSNVEKKDSGVEWIGEIPKHWEVNKLKFVSNVRPSSVDKHIFQEENQVLLCNYTDVYYNEFIDEKTELKKGSCSDEEFRKYKVKIGDVIITKDSETPNDIGIPCLIKSDFTNVVCGYHLSIITPKETVIGGYVFYQLKTQRVKSYFEINSNGITRYGLGKSSIEETLILLPPVLEQEKIVSYIDIETKKIDELVSIEKKRIETLKEYRQSMISEVITGKIRVCEEVSELQES